MPPLSEIVFETIVLLAIGLGVVLSSWLFVLTLKKLRQKQFRASFRNAVFTLFVLFFTAVSGLLISNFLTYQRLTYEEPIARLHIKPLEKQHFQILVVYLNDCHRREYELKGDEWQLEARIIKWHSWANLLGLNTWLQLDRIQGRYRSIEQQRQNLPTVFALDKQSELDLWALKKQYQWLPLLDAEYGQSVFMSMEPGQWYEVHLSQTGLVARKIKPVDINVSCSVTGLTKEL